MDLCELVGLDQHLNGPIHNRIAVYIVYMMIICIRNYVPQYCLTTSSLPQSPLMCLAWCLYS